MRFLLRSAYRLVMRNKLFCGAGVLLLSSVLGGCAASQAHVSVPLGPLGQVGVSLGGDGRVTGHVGVGGRIGNVSVGAGTQVPISE